MAGQNFQQGQAEQKRIDESNAVADAEIAVIDVENDLLELRSSDAEAQATLANIHSDGIITEEEQQLLDELQPELARLDNARRSGNLNQSQFQTRFNKLKKQFLNDTRGLEVMSA